MFYFLKVFHAPRLTSGERRIVVVHGLMVLSAWGLGGTTRQREKCRIWEGGGRTVVGGARAHLEPQAARRRSVWGGCSTGKEE
jgi:hypothetical protein